MPGQISESELNNLDAEEKECLIKLKYFVKKFVSNCECALCDYWRRLQSKSEKPGKSADLICKAKGNTLYTKVGLSAIQYAVNKIGVKNNRNNTKKLLALLYKYEEDRKVVRIVLIKSAIEIFLRFENQFVQVMADNFWQRAIEKLAEDAVIRMIQYFKKISEEFSTSTVIKCFIYGESKTTLLQTLTRSQGGHTVRYKEEDMKTTDLFEKSGLVLTKENSGLDLTKEHFKYFERNDQPNEGLYGYRLLFHLENLEKQNETYKLLFDNVPLSNAHYHNINPTKQVYQYRLSKYILNEASRKECEETLLHEINERIGDNESNQFLDGLRPYIDKISDDNTIFEDIFKQPEMVDLIDEYMKKEFMKINPCHKYGLREPISSFFGRDDELDEINNHITDKIIIISGLGGMGKTELALEYAKDVNDSNVVFINSKTYSNLHESFKEILFSIGQTTQVNQTESQGRDEINKKIIKKISNKVYDYFKGKNCVFIFDDLQDDINIIEFLPPDTGKELPPDRGEELPLDIGKGKKSHRILITTPKSQIINLQERSYKEIKLKYLENKDATRFVKKHIDKINERKLKQLMDLLEPVLPLALQYVVSYINRDVQNTEKNLDFIIECLQQEHHDELTHVFNQKILRTYDKSVIFIINNTIDKIKQSENRNTSLAEQILNLIAYFAPHNIPQNIFLPLINKNSRLSEQYLLEAVNLLKDYGVINKENNLINVHQLLQKVIRSQHTDNGKQILTTAVDLTLDLFYHSNDESLLPHIVSVCKYACKDRELIIKYMLPEVNCSTLLHLMSENSFKVLEIFFENINNDILSKIIDQRGVDGKTLLHCAVLSGNSKSVDLLHQKGFNIHAVDSLSFTPLHLAAERGHKDTVANLLRLGANVKQLTKQGFSAIHFAAKNNYPEIVGILLRKIENINSEVFCSNDKKHTPLHLAARRGHEKCVKKLLKKGANINAMSRENFTALHFAAQNGFTKVVEEILERSKAIVNLYIRTHKGFTPLDLAIYKNHKTIVELFQKFDNDRQKP